MARPYWLAFGASAVSGLAPTFINFRTTAGSTLAPPSISEPGSFGRYLFSYDALTNICFIADGATTGLAFSDRYITGVLDPSDNMGVTLQALGNTAVALGISNLAQGATMISNLGGTSSSFGTNSVDPTTVFGFLKRALEGREGNETYMKATGILDIYSRGSSQLLAEKTIDDDSSSTTKS